MGAKNRGLNKAEQEILGKLASNMDGSIELIRWQLRLAEEMKSYLAALGWSEKASKAGQKACSKKGARSRKR